MDSENPFDASVCKIDNRFIRGRSILLSEVDCSPLFDRLALHRAEHKIPVNPVLEPIFRNLLAAFTLHCASRPRNETLAWTIRFANPLSTFFFAGDAEIGSVVGRYFTENVKAEGPGEMFQELFRPNKPLHRSMVQFEGSTAEDAVTRFYSQSEQRPCRFFPLESNRYCLLSAHPDWDEEWFHSFQPAQLNDLESHETVNLIESRAYRWLCGCSHSKLCSMLAPVYQKDPAKLFGEDEVIAVLCPRCAASYRISREAIEASITKSGSKSS